MTLRIISAFLSLCGICAWASGSNCAASWHGARWIGGDESARSFYSQYLPVFQLTFDLQLTDSRTRAGIIYGANDLRLLDDRKNLYGLKNQPDSSYVELQFGADSLRVLRHRYQSGQPVVTLGSFAIPEAVLLLQKRHVTVNSNTGITTVSVDTVQVATLNVSPTPGGGDYIAYPVVGDVGYSVSAGKAIINDFRVNNFRSPHNTLAAHDFGSVEGFKIISLPQTGTTTLRRRFHIGDKTITKATLRATARGIYDAYLNGELIDPLSYLNPGASQYNISHYYQIYDLTPLIKPDSNELGFSLAEGWWSGAASFDPANWNWFGDRQSLLCCLDIEYADGSADHIISEPDGWEFSNDGPVRYGSLFQGEVYDASRQMFTSGSWRKAETVPLAGVISDTANGDWPLADDYSQLRLIEDNDAAVDAFDELAAVSVREVSPGQYVYDMGVNHAGIPSLTFRGLNKGQKVTIRYAEELYPENQRYTTHIGKPMVENLRTAMCQDIYIASGAPVETFSPRTTYHGYRYMEITGIGQQLPQEDVKSIILSSVSDFTSGFECSDSLINRLVANIRRSTLSNVFSIPTDCPQRNERMGWSGDVSVFAPAMTYLCDARGFLNRHTRALRDTRSSDGTYSPVAPMGGGFGGPLWQSAGIILPWQLYVQYADTAALADNYPAMKNYIEMVVRDYIDPDSGHFRGTGTWKDLGDWLGPQCNQNEKPLLFDSYLIHELGIMEKAAEILGMDEDAQKFAVWRDQRMRFINNAYVSPEHNALIGRGFGNQESVWSGPLGGQKNGQRIDAHSSYAVPLALNVFSNENKPVMAAALSSLVNQKSKGDDGKEYPAFSLMTGFVGTPWILYALADNGYASDAYSILLNRTYPSWLYPVELGATSVWERLNSMTREDGFGGNNGMNSFNHYAFGCVYDWLMQRCAGINPDPEAPGFKHIILRPTPDPTGRLTYARAWYDSASGRVESSWQKTGDLTRYTFTIPDGTSASAYLPDGIHTLAPGTHTFEI